MHTEIVLSPKAWNASIAYRVPAVKTKWRIFRFWLMEVSQAHALSGKVVQAKMFSHFYAKSYAPGAVSITGRVRTQVQYDQLAEFIRAHQKLMVSQSGRSNAPGTDAISLMTLGIPDENLYYAGWIPTFSGGAKRFNPAPEFTFNFEVVHDRHSTASQIIPSAAKRSVFTGAFLDGPIKPTPDKEIPFQTYFNYGELDERLPEGQD